MGEGYRTDAKMNGLEANSHHGRETERSGLAWLRSDIGSLAPLLQSFSSCFPKTK